MKALKSVFFLVLMCLVGCTSHAPPPKSHLLRMNISREPITLDPRKGSELVSASMHYLLYEGLVRLNPNGSISPAQARSVEISDDRLTYTFHMRGTHWSNGTKVTAKDFEYSWKKIISPQFAAANAHLLFAIKNAEKVKRGLLPLDEVGITAVNDQTLVVRLEKPTPYFLELVAFCVFFPVNQAIDMSNPQWVTNASDNFVTNGPFKLKEWKHNHEIVLEKNPKYWEARQINLEEIKISMVADEATALGMYERGELDIIGNGISPLPTDALLSYYQHGVLKTYSSPGTTFICFNVNKVPFNNSNIRKAFSLAINRSQIVQNITQLGEEVATTILPPILNANHSQPLVEDHAIEKAQKHLKMGLKELGISLKEFPPVTLNYSSSEVNRKLVQVLQEQWMQTLGIQVELQSCEHKTLLDRLGNRSYDMAQAFWVAQYFDPMNILERFKFRGNAKNYPGWENPAYTRLLDQSAYDPTPEQRAETLAKAEALLGEEMPLTPLYHWKSSFLIKDHLAYEEFTPGGAFDYARIFVKKEKQ